MLSVYKNSVPDLVINNHFKKYKKKRKLHYLFGKILSLCENNNIEKNINYTIISESIIKKRNCIIHLQKFHLCMRKIIEKIPIVPLFQ